MDNVNSQFSVSQNNRNQMRTNINNMETQFQTFTAGARNDLNKQDEWNSKAQNGIRQIFQEHRDKTQNNNSRLDKW